MSGRRVLITGGAGFIGSHQADHLLGHGYRVRALDSLSPRVNNLDPRGPGHLARMDRYLPVNDLGTAVLHQALVERPVERLVVASSMSPARPRAERARHPRRARRGAAAGEGALRASHLHQPELRRPRGRAPRRRRNAVRTGRAGAAPRDLRGLAGRGCDVAIEAVGAQASSAMEVRPEGLLEAVVSA